MNTFIDSFAEHDIMQQLQACIGCQECLLSCPILEGPISLSELNAQTYGRRAITFPVAKFARACTQCGACVSVCPIGLRRDAMMVWLKLKLNAENGRERPDHENRGHWKFVKRLFA